MCLKSKRESVNNHHPFRVICATTLGGVLVVAPVAGGDRGLDARGLHVAYRARRRRAAAAGAVPPRPNPRTLHRDSFDHPDSGFPPRGGDKTPRTTSRRWLDPHDRFRSRAVAGHAIGLATNHRSGACGVGECFAYERERPRRPTLTIVSTIHATSAGRSPPTASRRPSSGPGNDGSRRAWRTCAFCESARQHFGARLDPGRSRYRPPAVVTSAAIGLAFRRRVGAVNVLAGGPIRRGLQAQHLAVAWTPLMVASGPRPSVTESRPVSLADRPGRSLRQLRLGHCAYRVSRQHLTPP